MAPVEPGGLSERRCDVPALWAKHGGSPVGQITISGRPDWRGQLGGAAA